TCLLGVDDHCDPSGFGGGHMAFDDGGQVTVVELHHEVTVVVEAHRVVGTQDRLESGRVDAFVPGELLAHKVVEGHQRLVVGQEFGGVGGVSVLSVVPIGRVPLSESVHVLLGTDQTHPENTGGRRGDLPTDAQAHRFTGT